MQLNALESPARIESHPDSHATLRHAFSDDEIAYYAALPDCHAVVSHGAPLRRHDMQTELLATEFLPVYVHQSNDVTAMSLPKIQAILRGEISAWEQLGRQRGGQVRIYLHGAELQKCKFEVLAKSIGVLERDLFKTTRHYCPNYAQLGKAGSEDPNCLVLGLKSGAGHNLKPLPVDGIAPFIHGIVDYKLVLPIYLLHRGTAEAQHFEEQLIARLDGATSIRLVH